MAKEEKFASQMDTELLAQLRAYSAQTGRTISAVLRDAVTQFLEREQVRPAFRDAAEAVLSEHDELLARLAR